MALARVALASGMKWDFTDLPPLLLYVVPRPRAILHVLRDARGGCVQHFGLRIFIRRRTDRRVGELARGAHTNKRVSLTTAAVCQV